MHDLKSLFKFQESSGVFSEKLINAKIQELIDTHIDKIQLVELPEKIAKLKTKVGVSLFYFYIEINGKLPFSKSMELVKIWSDELDTINDDYKDYISYIPAGNSIIPLFVKCYGSTDSYFTLEKRDDTN